MKNRKNDKKNKRKNKEGYVYHRRNKTIKSKIAKVKRVACLSNRRSMEQSLTNKGARRRIKK